MALRAAYIRRIIVRKHMLALGMVAALVAAPALADKVAVLDSQAALLGTEAAKRAIDSLNSTLKPQRDRMDVLKKEIQALEAKAQKDAAVMSQKDKEALQKQAEAKFNEYNGLAQTVQQRAGQAQQTLFQGMVPKMEAVIEELRKAGAYTVIVEKKNVIWADPTVDLTKKVTEKLNAAK